MTDKLLLFAAFVFVMLIMSFNYTKKKKKIIFFGDTVKEQGLRAGGYISKIQSFINKEGLDDKYAVVGVDISGDKIYDWYTRLAKDVLAQGADIVVLFIGLQNVPGDLSGDANQVEQFYNEVVHKLTSAGIEMIVCTPTLPLTDVQVGRIDLLSYRELVRTLAKQNNLKLVDLSDAFQQNDNAVLQTNESEPLITQGKYLSDAGNEIVAEEIWKVIMTPASKEG